MKILHIGDIHYRLNDRHEQYRKCFSWLFNYIQKEEIDYVCIPGDLVHSYLNFNLELFNELSWFYKNLSKASKKTFIINGNHDLNLFQIKKGSISESIVNEENIQNIHFFKKCESFKLSNDIDIIPFPLEDKKNWENIKVDENKINVGMAHVCLQNSSTDLGHTLPGELHIEFFEKLGIDFLLCSDIHLRQVLSERFNKNNKKMPWAMYSGSPIAQNFAEKSERGGLVWDIKSKNDWNVYGFNIPNSNPFITINYKQDVFSTLNDIKKYPETSNFRIIYKEEIPEIEKKQIINELKENKAEQVVFKSEIETDTSNIKTGNLKLKKDDLKNHESHIKLLKNYLSEQKLKESDWQFIEKISKKYFDNLEMNNKLSKAKKWTIEQIKFSKTYGYGDNNIINFNKLSGITGIFGKNKIGKSSFAGTISYGLFGSSDRGSLKNVDIVNDKSDNCSVEIIFNSNNKKFLLKREINKKISKKNITAISSLDLKEVDKDLKEIENFNSMEKGITENKIKSLIGTKDDFFYTSFAAQDELKSFIKEGSTKRKLYINRFLGLDIFEKIYSLAKEDFDVIKAQIKNLKEKNWDIEIKNLNEKYNSNLNEIDNLSKKLKGLDEEIYKEQTKLSQVKINEKKIITKEEIANIENKLKNLKSSKETLGNKQKLIKSDIEQTKEKIDKIGNVFKKISIKDIEKELEKQYEVEKSLNSLESQYKIELAILNSQKKSAQKLKTIPCGEEYPQCRFIKSSFIDKSKLPTQENKIKNFLEEIKNIKNNLENFKSKDLKQKKEK